MRYVHKFYQFIGSQDRTKDSFISPNIIFEHMANTFVDFSMTYSEIKPL